LPPVSTRCHVGVARRRMRFPSRMRRPTVPVAEAGVVRPATPSCRRTAADFGWHDHPALSDIRFGCHAATCESPARWLTINPCGCMAARGALCSELSLRRRLACAWPGRCSPARRSLPPSPPRTLNTCGTSSRCSLSIVTSATAPPARKGTCVSTGMRTCSAAETVDRPSRRAKAIPVCCSWPSAATTN
jgi:hypothetical protein